MRRFLTVLLVGACVLGTALPSFAQQQTPDQAFKGVYGPPSDNAVANSANIALYEYEISKGGFGSSSSVSNTTVGTINETNTYNGPVSSSGATNSVNWNSFNSSIHAEDGSTVTLTAPTSQTSGSAGQTATAIDITKTQP